MMKGFKKSYILMELYVDYFNYFCLFVEKKADCTITMSDNDLLALMTGKMNPQTVSIFCPKI